MSEKTIVIKNLISLDYSAGIVNLDLRIVSLCSLYRNNKDKNLQYPERDRSTKNLGEFIDKNKYFLEIIIPLKRMLDEDLSKLTLEDLHIIGISDRTYRVLSELAYQNFQDNTDLELLNILNENF